MRLKVIVLGICFHQVLCDVHNQNKLPSDPAPNTGSDPSALFDQFSAGYTPDINALPPSFRSPQEGVDPAGSLPPHHEFKPSKESLPTKTGVRPIFGSDPQNTGFNPPVDSLPPNTGFKQPSVDSLPSISEFKPSTGSLPKTRVNAIKTPTSKPVDKNSDLIKSRKYAKLIQKLFKNMQPPPVQVRKGDGKPKKINHDLRIFNNNLPIPGKPDGGIMSLPKSDKPKHPVKTVDVGTQTGGLDPFYTAHLKPKLKPGCKLQDLYAKCYLQANPTFGDGPIKGTILLSQMVIPNECKYDFINIQVNVKDGPRGPRRSNYHGFHVHEYGDMNEGCEAMGGHYNPFESPHGSPRNNKYNRHVGDLGNVRMNSRGRVRIRIVDYLAKLYGSESIVGRGLVLHEGKDDLGRGKDVGSLKTGNAGRRLACCTIVRSKQHSTNNYTLYGR